MTDSEGIVPREAEFLFYRTEDGRARVDGAVRRGNSLADAGGDGRAFQTTPQKVGQHVAAINAGDEFDHAATCKQNFPVRREGFGDVPRQVKHNHLPIQDGHLHSNAVLHDCSEAARSSEDRSSPPSAPQSTGGMAEPDTAARQQRGVNCCRECTGSVRARRGMVARMTSGRPAFRGSAEFSGDAQGAALAKLPPNSEIPMIPTLA